MLRTLLDRFWDESIWLPPNTTWSDITPGPDKLVVYTDYRHILFPIPLAFVLIVLRSFFEKFFFAPFGKSLGIKSSRTKRASKNPLLENAYQSSSKLKPKQHNLAKELKIYISKECNFSSPLVSLAKQLDLTERQVERWWRLRRSQDKPSTLVKFCENMWRCTFYTFSFTFGMVVLWDKSWFWDIDQCYLNYPHHGITNDIWWYYMITCSFYWSLSISQFWDVQRKDFWQMFIHHLASIALLSLSWVANLHRIGTLVVVVHDSADILLEAAKASKYAKYQRVCDVVFAFFTVLWIVTRLGIFPFYILWSTTIRAPMLLPVFYTYYIMNSLLLILLFLHLIWTWLILQVVYNTITTGRMERDIRSDSSDLSDSSRDSAQHNNDKKET